jgi:putative SOS response-associated peptidase YedK
MINSIPEPHLEPYEVSTAVNSLRNNDQRLLEPVSGQ